ncbi:hypothetical protein AURANDRAFT_23570, partial [Aureococcus anophagefferens]
QIMRGVSGRFDPCTSTAIMGASGAGKTTLMNLVVGKVKKTKGTIRVNGEVVESLQRWKSRLGFVPQEDIMHRRLTVLQNIAFSASLRLPTTMSEEDKALRVRDALKVLRLDQVRHSIIGDEMQRGVSGGQRKRVNVAIEIVADPSVLFLDEPTSGLDSVSSTELARMLGDIARRKRLTIAAVVHSPSPAAFAAFTDLILLQTGGTPVYVGKLPGCEPYLASIGFTYPRGEKNGEPFADYMMGVVAGIDPRGCQTLTSM